MQAAGEVEPDALRVPPRLPDDGAAAVPQPNARAVEVVFPVVVLEAVGHYEVEVLLELVQAAVAVRVDALPHGREVHGVRDDVQVIGNLMMTEQNSDIGFAVHGGVCVCICVFLIFLVFGGVFCHIPQCGGVLFFPVLHMLSL